MSAVGLDIDCALGRCRTNRIKPRGDVATRLGSRECASCHSTVVPFNINDFRPPSNEIPAIVMPRSITATLTRISAAIRTHCVAERPLAAYKLVHAHARLSAEERDQLARGLSRT